jgi:hypothetical protein
VLSMRYKKCNDCYVDREDSWNGKLLAVVHIDLSHSSTESLNSSMHGRRQIMHKIPELNELKVAIFVGTSWVCKSRAFRGNI